MSNRAVRVDAHHHVWDLAVRDQPWTTDLPALRRSFGFEQLRPSLTKHGFEATVVVQTVCVPEETPELLALAAAEPTVAGVVGWVELTAADVADHLHSLRDLPGGTALVGVRHQVQDEPDPAWLCRPDVRRGLAAVAEADLSYDLLVRPAQLPAVLETVRSLPAARFILDHAGKPDIAGRVIADWRANVTELAALPNVAVKLSGLVTEAGPGWRAGDLEPYVRILLDRFGVERVMFGSDWPVCLLTASYDDVTATAEQLTSGCSDSERGLLFGGTAQVWYRLRR